MVVQVVAIVFLLLEDGNLPASWYPHAVGTALLYAALALALYSGNRYLLSFWKQSSSKGL
jgi:phosphatidylglycerophosphate synthase